MLPADDPRPNEAADLVNLLKMQGCEVHRADKDVETKEGKFPAGSYVVRMDQPYSRMADMLLDTQYFNVNDPRPTTTRAGRSGRCAMSRRFVSRT